jgi:hypothetical protein
MMRYINKSLESCSTGVSSCSQTGASSPYLGALDFRATFFGLDVARQEELSKQNEQTQNVHDIRHNHAKRCFWTLRYQQVRSLGHHGNKLNHLHQSQRGFPPNGQGFAGFRDFSVHTNDYQYVHGQLEDMLVRHQKSGVNTYRSSSRTLTVIRVHDSMNETIQGNGQVDISIVVDV